MTSKIKNAIPPAIRLFLSSTFSDMERERTYFASQITPKLTAMAKERGVSFFTVDLRWGITEEEQLNGEVLPICLSEIDKCRPFFVGIIGNRYGSTIDNLGSSLTEGRPWLVGKEGKSITEVEMLYGVLEKEDVDDTSDCAFFFRSEELSRQWFGVGNNDTRVEELKKAIKKRTDIPSAEYSSLEDFARLVIDNFTVWLDREFPKSKDAAEMKKAWYTGELLRDHVPNRAMQDFLAYYLENNSHSLVLHGEGKRGKSAFLTGFALERENAIIVNCGATEALQSSLGIIGDIVKELMKIDTSLDLSYVLEGDSREVRAKFGSLLASIKTEKKIEIYINDINLLGSAEFELLSFLPTKPQESVKIVVSTNNPVSLKNFKALGWNDKEMPLFSDEDREGYLLGHLKNYGKNLSTEEKNNILACPLSSYVGIIKLISSFLISHGSFENLGELTQAISKCKTANEIYKYTLDYATRGFTDKEKLTLKVTLTYLYLSNVALSESEYYSLVSDTVGTDALIFAKVRSVLEEFGLADGDEWKMQDRDFMLFVGSETAPEDAKSFRIRLADKLLEKFDEEPSARIARATLYQIMRSGDFSLLENLFFDDRILKEISCKESDDRRFGILIVENHPKDLKEVIANKVKQYTESDKPDLARKLLELFSDLGAKWCIELSKEYGIEIDTQGVRGMSPECRARLDETDRLRSTESARAIYEAARKIEDDLPDLTREEALEVMEVRVGASVLIGEVGEVSKELNEYYMSALECASSYHIMMSSLLRSRLYLSNSDSKSARIYANEAYELALIDGRLTGKLDAEEIIARLMTEGRRADDAISLLGYVKRTKRSLGDTVGYIGAESSLAAATKSKGKVREAKIILARLLKLALKRSEEEPDSTALLKAALEVETDLATLLYEQDENEKAEKLYKNVIRRAKEKRIETTLIRGLTEYAKLLEGTKRYTLAADTQNLILEEMFERRNFDDFKLVFLKQKSLLYTHSYAERADRLEAEWTERLLSIGVTGVIDSDARLVSEGVDLARCERLKEAVNLARASRDRVALARALIEYSKHVVDSDLAEAVSATAEAADLYYTYSESFDKEHYLASLTLIKHRLGSVIENGVPKDVDLLKTLAVRLRSKKSFELLELWLRLGRCKDEKSFGGYLSKVGERMKEDKYFTSQILNDLVPRIAEFLPVAAMKTIIENSKKGKDFELFRVSLRKKLIDDESRDITFLKKEYSGPRADAILTRYVRAIDLVKDIDTEAAAIRAGNVATIYRRRNNESKCFHYHRMSAEMYSSLGMRRDYLIEMENMASAEANFGYTERCIKTLRDALRDAEEYGERELLAAIAGNLAHHLTLSKEYNTGMDSEIIHLYEIEEGYFRSQSEFRELCISLVNQIAFYSKKDIRLCKDKFTELQDIVRRYSLVEFNHVVNALAAELSKSGGGRVEKKPGGTVNKDVTAFAKTLRGIFKGYECTEEEKNGSLTLHFVPVKARALIINFIVEISFVSEISMRLFVVLKPQTDSPEAHSQLQGFKELWNREGESFLTYLYEEKVLMYTYEREADARELSELTRTVLRLGEFDAGQLGPRNMKATSTSEIVKKRKAFIKSLGL